MKTKQFFNIPVIRSLTANERLTLINLLNKIDYNSLRSSRNVMKQLNTLIWAIAIPDNDPNFFVCHAYAPSSYPDYIPYPSYLSLVNDANHVNDTRIGIRLPWSRQGSLLLQLLMKNLSCSNP